MTDPWIREVSDGVFAYVQPDGGWWINNTGFLVGPDSVVSIDTCGTERRSRAYRDAIASTTALSVRTIVNTHHHGDHTHGNGYFPEAIVVGHEKTRAGMLARRPIEWYSEIFEVPEWGEVRPTPPSLTYVDGVTLYRGDLRCDVRYVGSPAHTEADSVVWLPEHRVLFAGDLAFNGGTPFVLMGSVSGALTALAYLKSLGAATIVPGHGDPCGPEVLDATIGYLRFIWGIAMTARTAGLSPLAAAREVDLGEYACWLDRERLVGNLHRAYADQDGEGAEVDVAAAFRDMIAFNGGRLLPCHA